MHRNTSHSIHIAGGVIAGALLILWIAQVTTSQAGPLLSSDAGKEGSNTNIPVVCGPGFVKVASPNQGANNNMLRAIDAASANDIWAVGYYIDDTHGHRTLTEHWDGTSWTIIASANHGSDSSALNSVRGSGNNVWAAGYYFDSTFHDETLVERWNGSAWSIVPSVNPGINQDFDAIAVLSPTNAWAVGYYDDGSGAQALIEHWDGTNWTVVSNPTPSGGTVYLNAVRMISASNVWAVGSFYDAAKSSSQSSARSDNTSSKKSELWQPGANQGRDGTTGLERTLIEHWDGTSWTIVPSPNVGSHDNYLSAVAQVSSTDIWAVGGYIDDVGGHTLMEHWDGTSWTMKPSPNSSYNNDYLNAVHANSSSDVWASGNSAVGYYEYSTLLEHWDGSAWSIVHSANPSTTENEFLGIAAITTNDVVAVGDYQGATTNRTLVESLSQCAPTPTACPIQFTDVPQGSTFYSYVHCLACIGTISGYSDNTFRPNNNVTRGQLSKTVSNAGNITNHQATQMFQDVPQGSTYFDYINSLASLNLIGGYPCGSPGEPCIAPNNLPYFRPNNNATRGQISKIDANAALYHDAPTGQQFEDVPVGSTFYTYTYRLVTRNIMGGYACSPTGDPCGPGNLPYFHPNNNATRGQTSKIVGNTFFPDCAIP